jgi:hypothetical protein
MTNKEIIDKFIEYQIEFVEKKSSWGNSIVCPFAKKTRLENKIIYKVHEFYIETCLNEDLLRPINEFANQDHFLVMLYIHPKVDAMDYISLESLVEKMEPVLFKIGVEVFSGHPQHELKVNDTFLRREPFINLQFLSANVSKEATKKLKETNYYHGWNAKSLEYIQ